MASVRFGVLVTSLSATSAALAQAPLYDISGTAGDQLSQSVAWVGDLDSDGFDDVAFGAPFGNGSQTDAGYVVIISGRTAAPIHTLLGQRTGDLFGWSVAGLGDIDADGVGDLIVGAPTHEWIEFQPGSTDRGAVYTISGATGAQIWKLGGNVDFDWLGWSVAGVGDVNGDGVGDYASGQPAYDIGGTDAGRVNVHSGANHTGIRTFLGEDPGDFFGWSLAGAGDVTGDGVPDIVTGAPYYDTGFTQPAGRAYLLSVPSPAQTTVLATGSSTGGQLGHSVGGGFDADADGVPDIVLGEPFRNVGGIPAGRARVISGANLAVLHTFLGADNDQLGYSVAGLADADGDGHGDVIIGLPGGDIGTNADYGLTQVYSGATWQLLYQWNGYHLNERMGHAVSTAGLLNADGFTDMASGSNSFDLNGTNGGRGRMVLGNATVATAYCTAKTNSVGCVPFISYAGCASVSISNGFHVVGANVLPNVSGNLIWSFAPNAAPFFGGTLCLASPIRRTPLQTSSNIGTYTCVGIYDFHFSHAYMASNALIAGTDVFAQFWSRDSGFPPPQNVGLTNALKFSVLP